MKKVRQVWTTIRNVAVILLAIFGLMSILAYLIGFRLFLIEESIMYWDGFISVVQTFGAIGSLGAIFAIMYTSNKQLKISSKIQRQNVRIQLTNERHSVFNEIVFIFNYLQTHNYSSLELLIETLRNEQNVSKIITFQKIKYLYNDQLFNDCNNLYKHTKCIESKINELKIIYEHIINKTGVQYKEFKKTVDNYLDPLHKSNNENAFKSICDKCKLTNIVVETLPRSDYNYYEMYKDKEKMIGKFQDDSKKLLTELDKELYINDIDL